MFSKINEYLSPIIIFLSTVAVISFNLLATWLPLNNQYTNVISDKYATAFTPQGYVFSIWGLIYILLALFSFWAFIKYKYHKAFIDDLVILHVLATIFNIFWLITWHYEQIRASMVPMVLLLGVLIYSYKLVVQYEIKGIKKMLFSVYLAWISVATIAQVAITLNSIPWDGFGISPSIWTSLLIVVATGLGYYMLTTYKDRAFYLVITWAAIGIWFNNPEDLYIFAIVFLNIMLFLTRSFALYVRKPAINVNN